jgi:hypothetical protein
LRFEPDTLLINMTLSHEETSSIISIREILTLNLASGRPVFLTVVSHDCCQFSALAVQLPVATIEVATKYFALSLLDVITDHSMSFGNIKR